MLAVQLLLRPITKILIHWCRLVDLACHPYRPELHYMRGPGPKWYAKHQAILRFHNSPNSGGANQFVSDRPPSITIAAPVT
jgi:hypothetical protein